MGHTFGVRVQRVQKVQRVQRGRLTGLRPEGCGGGFAAIFKKKGRGSAAGCIERLYSLRSGGDSAYGAEGCGLPFGQCL